MLTYEQIICVRLQALESARFYRDVMRRPDLAHGVLAGQGLV